MMVLLRYLALLATRFTAPHLQRARARARPVSFCVEGAYFFELQLRE